MPERRLANELWPQLKDLAEIHGYLRVTRVDMIVGSLHGSSAETLADDFRKVFRGGAYQDADIRITLVTPGESYSVPNSEEPQQASGWDIQITAIEGER